VEQNPDAFGDEPTVHMRCVVLDFGEAILGADAEEESMLVAPGVVLEVTGIVGNSFSVIGDVVGSHKGREVGGIGFGENLCCRVFFQEDLEELGDERGWFHNAVVGGGDGELERHRVSRVRGGSQWGGGTRGSFSTVRGVLDTCGAPRRSAIGGRGRR